MSDPTIEEDSLISQDDIDKLMESSSVEDLDENFSQSDDELGELSQDDIDSLMNSNVTAPEPSGDNDEDDEMELISQNDIDQLMNSSALDDDDTVVIEEAVDAEEDSDGSADDFGELSQNDIDSLMNSNASSDKALNDVSDDADEDDFEMISQDDINSLMSDSSDTEDAAASEPEPEPEPEPAVEPVEEAIEESVPKPAPEAVREAAAIRQPVSKPEEENDVIDESEAVEVQDALITQETLDDLIKNFKNEPEPVTESEPVILDETPEPEIEADAEEMEPMEDFLEASGDQTADEDDFLIPDTDSGELNFDNDEDVSQEDIDALLLDDDEDQEDDDILISQDDIDTLLMAADQEDEDVLGDLMDDSIDSAVDDEDLLDEDIMATDDFEEDPGSEDQVVLEEGNNEPAKPAKKIKKIKKIKLGSVSPWYKSKLVIACASALLVLGITVPLTYFIFSSDKPADPRSGVHVPTPPSAPVAVEKPLETRGEREIEIETVDVNVQKMPEYNQSGNMILQDFVILASDTSKELTYITADISIDYYDQRAYHEINNNLSFYRDLIYDSINKSLASEKRDETTEADILWIVETTLKKVLPEQYIKKVSFKSFKAT